VSSATKVFSVAVLVALASALAADAEAQPPIRVGASLALTGQYAVFGQNQHRGYQLCFKHVNEKGGVLGRRIELVRYDDQSQPATAVRLYEQLITQDKVDLIIGPYASPITEAVADVSEKYRMPMVASGAAATSIFRQGRKFVFQVFPRGEVYLEGFVDMAARKGLKTVAVIYRDAIASRELARGAIELARKKGLEVVFVEAYPERTTDFSALLAKVRAANPDALAVASYFEDTVAITRQMKDSNVNPKMYGLTTGVDSLRFYELLGRTVEFIYGVTPWVPELVELRAGGLIPIARQYPGAREFVEAHRKEFPGADLSYHTAAGYGGCEILVEAIRRAGSLDSEKLREAILKIDRNTVFGAFRVDRDGAQIAHRLVMFQWQDGKKVIVWPEELAPGQPRFPTPPWSQRP
jgi:branched-chain amino acid transport system substrate-binding protein